MSTSAQPVVAVTGASGFVGRVVCRMLTDRGFPVIALARTGVRVQHLPGLQVIEAGDIQSANWPKLLSGVDVVVHLAARAHVTDDDAADSLEAYRAVNVGPTRSLAVAAATAGVRRVVYVSSIKVNGEGPTRKPYRASDVPAPVDAYGVSKLEAERALQEELADTRTSFTIVRPPLVYGPEVRANFLRLMRWIDRGGPLPLGSVNNRRSLIYVENLADLLVRCVEIDAAAGRTFLASDGTDLSTPDLVRGLARALGKAPRLFPFPVPLLRLAGVLVGREATIRRLSHSLAVDGSPAREMLGWKPPSSPEEGLAATARWYAQRCRPTATSG